MTVAVLKELYTRYGMGTEADSADIEWTRWRADVRAAGRTPC